MTNVYGLLIFLISKEDGLKYGASVECWMYFLFGETMETGFVTNVFDCVVFAKRGRMCFWYLEYLRVAPS